MNNSTPPPVLSDWYELVAGNELMQGDIFQGCPIFRPPAELNWPLENNEGLEFNVGKLDVVVMSQSCDLQAGQKQEMSLVMLCPVWKLSEAAAVNQFLASSYGKEECRRGHLPGYHMLAQCEHDQWKQEISIVSFREVWSLPLNFLRQMTQQLGPRPRIRPPYREHLAQAFARYVMRVGLPVDIAPFRSEKAEAEVLKKLSSLDEEARKRIIASFA